MFNKQNEKAKPPKRPVVAFYKIEDEIYQKARQKVTDLTADDSSEDKGDDQNGPNVEQEERSPIDRDLAFDLDGDVNLKSMFLQDMLSDVRTAVPSLRGCHNPRHHH